MTVKINNHSHYLDQNYSLTSVLSQLNLFVETGIAVAINEEVIPRKDWNELILKDQDEVLVITATQGG